MFRISKIYGISNTLVCNENRPIVHKLLKQPIYVCILFKWIKAHKTVIYLISQDFGIFRLTSDIINIY